MQLKLTLLSSSWIITVSVVLIMIEVVYSGTPLLWTPLGQFELSLFQRCITYSLVHYCCFWDYEKCPYLRGVLISECLDLRGFTV